jgi:hypothetical protein
MARLTLTPTQNVNKLNSHRASATEGEAAIRLLEEQGFPIKRVAHGQAACACPFHEGPGQVEPRKSAKFYVNIDSGLFYCQHASCGERGNLRLLEKFFGIDSDDGYTASFQTREDKLRLFESLLTAPLRKPFHEHGLTDQTIERFRLGYEPQHTETIDGREVTIGSRYVIPYLEGRRPKLFRYYSPYGDPKWKYTWEAGAEACLYNAQDAVGDSDGIVMCAEGEIKCALLVQLGYAAVGVPGAGQWREEWQAGFTHARQVIFVYDNDNPFFHNYDKPDKGQHCQKCAGRGLDRCAGHNPGQDAAVVRVEQVGWRARNVVLPLPNDRAPKTDINDYFVRDGHTGPEFAELALNKRPNEYKVASLAEITASPPEEAVFLIDQGILPRSGRLLIAGKAKVGKSLLVDNLALSLAAGIPFLGRFPVDHPTRVLLLDRELSKWSLFKRLHDLIDYRPGYRAAMDNLLVDHDHLIRLDQKNAFEVLQALVEQNGAEVVILDTAYKFLAGDVESSSALMKAFEVLDKLIHTTDVAVVMTHHLRKGMAARGKENTDVADPDAVAGSFLWTGWPNATVLLNFLDRSVENPYNAVATFTAFRDHAAPDPLALYRSKDSIAYTAITDHSHTDAEPRPGSRPVQIKPTTEAVANLLLELCPTPEEDFLYIAAARFGVSPQTIKPYYLDALSSGAFTKARTKPFIVSFVEAEDAESWESEHGLPERPLDEPLFDVAGLPQGQP